MNAKTASAALVMIIGGLTLAVTFAVSAREPVDYVNPFIGAASTRPTKDELARLTAAGVKLDPNFEGFHGKLFPGAATPAGMVQLSPDTITGGDNGAGYSYPHTTIQGFSFNHAGEIQLLPALPKSWSNGSVKGLVARDGFTVDIAWKGGRVVSYRIAAKEPRAVKVRVQGEVQTVTAERY